jgi:hypothetical protein
MLFAAEDVPEAERLLAAFARDMPPWGDRIPYAALRCSRGDLARLRAAIQLGRTDWRDLLVEAHFANDVHAHERWQPRRGEPE